MALLIGLVGLAIGIIWAMNSIEREEEELRGIPPRPLVAVQARRIATIRRYWAAHREAGLRAFRAGDRVFPVQYVETTMGAATYGDFAAHEPDPVYVQTLHFSIERGMVVCEGVELERFGSAGSWREAFESDAAYRARIVNTVRGAALPIEDYHAVMNCTATGADLDALGERHGVGRGLRVTFDEIRDELNRNLVEALGVRANWLVNDRAGSARAIEAALDAAARSRNDVAAGRPVGSASQARAKSVALLKDWLSPVQREQYDRDGTFEVVGCHTKRRYRITNPLIPFNVHELGASGAVVCKHCFVPAGDLPVGDVMLAQKISLETNERAAMKVANHSPVGPRIPERVGQMTVDNYEGYVRIFMRTQGDVINHDVI